MPTNPAPHDPSFLKSVNALALRADGLIRGYHSWQDNNLNSETDTANAPKTLQELRNLAIIPASLAKIAREIMADAGFAALDPDVQHDLQAIAEEMETGVQEIDLIAHPDNAWPMMDARARHDATQRVPADDTHVSALRARFKGQKRGEAAGNFLPKK